jgi:hypothetical protein
MKNRKIASIALVIALGLTGSSVPAFASGLSSSNSATKLPQIATTGDFSMTFSKIDCTKKKIGSGWASSTADGVYCIVTATMKNISKKSAYIPASDITLVDSGDNEFEHESGLSMYLKGTFFLDKVSPGNKKTGYLVYDVPKGTKPSQLVISGGWFSDDVIVKL